MTSPLPFRTTERVRFEDVDLVGIMRYSASTRFLDVAEAELFRAAGMTVPEVVERLGVLLPRKVLHVEYQAPARWDDLLELHAGVTHVGRTSIRLDVELRGTGGSPLHVQAYVVLVCVDPDEFRPCPVPDELRERLEPYRAAPRPV